MSYINTRPGSSHDFALRDIMQTSPSYIANCRQSVETPAISDEGLIRLVIRRGDEWKLAFATLVERYWAWIHRRCLMRLGNPWDAEDATQEVILSLSRGLGSFAGRSSFLGWLRRVVDNECKTFAMRQARYQPTDHLDQLIEHAQIVQFQEADSMEKAIRVRRTLAALPVPARDILQLRFFKGFSLEQISQLLDISLSAAKMRLYRAFEHFKRLYNSIP